MSIGNSVRHRVIEVLETINFCRILTGHGAQRIRVAATIELQRPAVIGRLALCTSVIEKVRRIDLVGVFDMPFVIEAGYQTEGTTLQTVRVIRIERIFFPGFTA